MWHNLKNMGFPHPLHVILFQFALTRFQTYVASMRIVHVWCFHSLSSAPLHIWVPCIIFHQSPSHPYSVSALCFLETPPSNDRSMLSSALLWIMGTKTVCLRFISVLCFLCSKHILYFSWTYYYYPCVCLCGLLLHAQPTQLNYGVELFLYPLPFPFPPHSRTPLHIIWWRWYLLPTKNTHTTVISLCFLGNLGSFWPR